MSNSRTISTTSTSPQGVYITTKGEQRRPLSDHFEDFDRELVLQFKGEPAVKYLSDAQELYLSEHKRDREELADMIGGWSLKTVGQGYGEGYTLEKKHSWLEKIAI